MCYAGLTAKVLFRFYPRNSIGINRGGYSGYSGLEKIVDKKYLMQCVSGNKEVRAMGKFFDRLLRKEKRFMNKLKGGWLTIIVAIIGVTVIEITAFLTNPNRDILDLVRDVLVMAIGFFGGYEVRKIEKYVIPEYKLSIVFGFLFLGIGMVLNSLFQFGINLLSSSETYYGLIVIILCITALISMHKELKTPQN